MVELAAAAAGLATALAVLIVGGYPPPTVGRGFARALRRRILGSRTAAAAGCGWPWLDGPRLLGAEVAAALLGALVGFEISGLVALGGAGGGLAWGSLRIGLELRNRSLRRSRQDAVLEAVRSLRQLLETGGVSVAGALAALARRGPAVLRPEFERVALAAGSNLQARVWADAREAIGEPVFDLLSAAVLIQRPAGGELAPLFMDLEASVAAVYEVEREAEALQVQARSAAVLILALPLAFLTLMSALHSPYLDPYRQPVGELFLASMLGVMGASYAWILHWLRLPGEPRLRLRLG